MDDTERSTSRKTRTQGNHHHAADVDGGRTSTRSPASAPRRTRHRHDSEKPGSSRKHKQRSGKSQTRPAAVADTSSLGSDRRHDNASLSSSSQTLPNQYLRNVVYYQNRFIVVDSITHKHRGRSASGNLSTDSRSRRDKDTENRASPTADSSFYDDKKRTSQHEKSSRERKRKTDINTRPCTTDSKGVVPEGVSYPDIQLHGTATKKKSFLSRVADVLQDARVTGSDLRQLDEVKQSEYSQLEAVLNIILVSIGVALLLSVCVVIVYTAIGHDVFKSALKTLAKSFIVSLFVVSSHVSSLV